MNAQKIKELLDHPNEVVLDMKEDHLRYNFVDGDDNTWKEEEFDGRDEADLAGLINLAYDRRKHDRNAVFMSAEEVLGKTSISSS